MAFNSFFMSADLTYEGVHFNADFIRSITVEQFTSNRGFLHLWPKLSQADRKKRLAEVYKLATCKK